MTKRIRFITVATFIALTAACGSKDEESSSIEINKENAQEISSKVISSITAITNSIHGIILLIESIDATNGTTNLTCPGGGTETIIFDDADNSGDLSSLDTIKIIDDNCSDHSQTISTTGEIELHSINYSDGSIYFRNYTTTLLIEDNKTINIDGSTFFDIHHYYNRFTLYVSNTTRQLTVTTTSGSGSVTDILSQHRIVKGLSDQNSENYISSIKASFYSSLYDGFMEIDTPEELIGIVNNYPEQGTITISSVNSSSTKITATDTSLLDLKVFNTETALWENTDTLLEWNDLSAQYLWSF